MLEEIHAQLSSKHSHTHSVTRERVLPAVQVRPIEAGKERMTADLSDTAISAKWTSENFVKTFLLDFLPFLGMLIAETASQHQSTFIPRYQAYTCIRSFSSDLCGIIA